MVTARNGQIRHTTITLKPASLNSKYSQVYHLHYEVFEYIESLYKFLRKGG